MTFKQALKILNIEDYSIRIWNSNSHGELFHTYEYIHIAKTLGKDCSWFRPWFVYVVESAEQNWKRPESIFQHISTILTDHLNTLNKP